MIQQDNHVEIILYVADRARSRDFYKSILGYDPVVDVPGMTEFQLNEFCKLGLMPEKGIAKILKNKTQPPASGNGIPRCELYLMVDDPAQSMKFALKNGAIGVSNAKVHVWRHKVAYVQDPDGHIVAFAKVL